MVGKFLMITAFLLPSVAWASTASTFSHLQEVGCDHWTESIAIAPVSTEAPVDGLRATVAYFEELADGASTPLLMFLPVEDEAFSNERGFSDAYLEHLRGAEKRGRARWLMRTSLDSIVTRDNVGHAFWREAGWIWSGPSRQFCYPKATVTVTATLCLVDVASGEVVASTQIEETGERQGAMVLLVHSQQSALQCVSGAALHAKARGQALRQTGQRLALEAEAMLAKVIFEH